MALAVLIASVSLYDCLECNSSSVGAGDEFLPVKFSFRYASPVFRFGENYASLLRDPYFWDRFRITFSYVLLAVALEVVIGFALSFLFNSQDVLGKKVMLPILFAPMMIAPVAAGVFRFMYDPYWGVINHF